MLLLLLSCETSSVVYTPMCGLEQPRATATTVQPGELVTLTTRPLTTLWDTAITFGDQRLTPLSLERSECSSCDVCIDESGCATCGEVCESCVELCSLCIETVSIEIPYVSSGTWPLQVVNHHGRSPVLDFTVQAAVDSGSDSSP